MRTFFCAYCIDKGLDDFVFVAIRSSRAEAELELAAVPADQFSATGRVVVEETLAGLKKRLLDQAIAEANKVHHLIGVA